MAAAAAMAAAASPPCEWDTSAGNIQLWTLVTSRHWHDTPRASPRPQGLLTSRTCNDQEREGCDTMSRKWKPTCAVPTDHCTFGQFVNLKFALGQTTTEPIGVCCEEI